MIPEIKLKNSDPKYLIKSTSLFLNSLSIMSNNYVLIYVEVGLFEFYFYFYEFSDNDYCPKILL